MLSGGEQQRVTIARSIANSPKILLLDEPTGDLDTRSSDFIMKILVHLNKKYNITMVMVTHDEKFRLLSNQVIRMLDGKVFQSNRILLKERNQALRELDERVAQYEAGNLKDEITIKEGVYQEKTDMDMKMYGHVQIPKNFISISRIETFFTAVRKPQDYPILQTRFTPKTEQSARNSMTQQSFYTNR